MAEHEVERRWPAIDRRRFIQVLGAGGLTLGVSGALAACGGGSESGSGGATSTAAGGGGGAPRRGGVLRIGVAGGGSSETLDAQLGTSAVDFARQYQLYDPLVYYATDGRSFESILAEELESNATADEWTIRLRDGVEFHNGKTLDVEDLIFTLRRLADPNYKGKQLFKTNVDLGSLRKLDRRTLRFRLRTPSVTVPDNLAVYTSRIVPVDYDPQRPVGTGPFKFESFTPGQQSTFARFENYWREGPYVDRLIITSFGDQDAMINALLSGQLDIVEDVPLGQRRTLEANGQINLQRSLAPVRWTPFVMNMSAAPLDDVRVRQAIRLAVNRQQLVDQVLDGEGEVGNDIIWNLPLAGDPDVQQREQDLEQARALLREAGQEGLSLELVVAPVASSAVPGAEVFAEQARAAGMNIRVRKVDVSTFYGDQFLKRRFTTDYWSQQTYFAQCESMMFPRPGEPYNETHFRDEEWSRLMDEAVRTVDETRRWELVREAQRIEWERGGYVVWGVAYVHDAYANNVAGMASDVVANAGSHNFRGCYFTS